MILVLRDCGYVMTVGMLVAGSSKVQIFILSLLVSSHTYQPPS